MDISAATLKMHIVFPLKPLRIEIGNPSSTPNQEKTQTVKGQTPSKEYLPFQF